MVDTFFLFGITLGSALFALLYTLGLFCAIRKRRLHRRLHDPDEDHMAVMAEAVLTKRAELEARLNERGCAVDEAVARAWAGAKAAEKTRHEAVLEESEVEELVARAWAAAEAAEAVALAEAVVAEPHDVSWWRRFTAHNDAVATAWAVETRARAKHGPEEGARAEAAATAGAAQKAWTGGGTEQGAWQAAGRAVAHFPVEAFGGRPAEASLAHRLLPEAEAAAGCSLSCSVAEARAALLDGDAHFFVAFKEAQGSSEVSVGPWVAAGAGSEVREVRLRQAIRSRLSPIRSVRVLELHQRTALPCGRVVLKMHQAMLDVPYASHFAVLTKWLLQPEPPAAAAVAAPRGCVLHMSAEVAFSKHTIFSRRIATNGVEELRENYAQHFLPLLRKHLVAGESYPAL